MTAESYQQAYLARLVSASLVPVGYNKAIHLHDDDDDDDDDNNNNNNNNNNNTTITNNNFRRYAILLSVIV